MRRFTIYFRSLLPWLCLLGALPAFAQSGRVSGQVTDQSGGAISGATVQVVNQETLAKRETKTNDDGAYAVPYLPSGKYQIVVQASGFNDTASKIISLADGQAFVFSAQLAVGAVTSEVTVSGTTGSVELDTASISTTLSNKEVTSYGLNGRNFSQLITMAPGVSNQSGQDEAKVGVAGSAKFSVNGGRVEYNTFEVDGSDVLNTSINASRGQGQPLMVYPSIDAIQEMKVLTSDYSALYGKSASGSVLVTTKSGTGKFHGVVYGFIRNEMFNARNYFDQPEQRSPLVQGKPDYKTPLYRRLDFGATIGGPLFIPHLYNTNQSKTFFFFSEEVRREKTPVDYNQAVPTVEERAGDFQDICPFPTPGQPTDDFQVKDYPDCPHNNIILASGGFAPARQVTPSYTSSALLATGIIPLPNAVLGCNTTNPTPFDRCYVAAVSPPTHWREELFRIDHSLTPSQQLSFRYVHDAWDTVTLAPQWGVVQNSFPTVQNVLTGPGLNIVIGLTQTLPRGVLNRIAVSYSVQHIALTPQAGQGLTSLSRPEILDDPAALGGTPVAGTVCTQVAASSGTITECPAGTIFNNGFNGNKMPGLNFQGSNTAYGGHGFATDTGYAPWNQANPTYEFRDDVNKAIGKHNFQFGVEATLVQQNELSAVSGANSGDLQGLLTFSNQQSKFTSGNAFADFLMGPGVQQTGYTRTAIKSYTQDSGQGKYYNRYKMAEFYLQDDWHITSRFTLNLGFRGSLFGAWYNKEGTAYNWRPEAYSGAVGASIYVDPDYGDLIRKTGTGSASPGTPVALNPASLDPAIVNGLVQCGANSIPSSCMANSIFHPAPRFGFSWDPNGKGKTAIRGGYGLFWEHGTGYEANVGSLIGSAPLVLSETQSNVAASPPNGSNSNGDVGAYNTIGLNCPQGVTQCGTVPGFANGVSFPLNVTSIPTKAVYSNTQQWSLSVQHELHKSLIAQLAYVGTKGTHLTAVRDLNQLAPLAPGLNPFLPGQPITSDVCKSGAQNLYFTAAGLNAVGAPITIPTSPGIGPTSPGYNNMVVACSGNPGFVSTNGKVLGLTADTIRPFPGFSNIISLENIADSSYHAFQSTLRETAGPITFGVAYTYSHSLDDSSDRSSANFANSLDIHSNHASSDFDQRHLLNISYVYDLPLLQLLQRFIHLMGTGSDVPESEVSAGSVNRPGMKARLAPVWITLLGGWQLSGITTHQSGTPFSVVNGGGANGTGPADNAGVGNGLGVGSYVDVIGSARGAKPHVATGSNLGPLLLNPQAFAAPRGLTFGNSGRNYLNNPARTNFNATLMKHFKPFGEGRDIEFRAEAYNVFNHTQFRIYDPSHPGNTGNNVANCYGSQAEFYSAGSASCLVGNSFLHPVDAHDPRILQFGLKLAF